MGINVLYVGLESLVRNFYENTYATTQGTRRSFACIGQRLTEHALSAVPLLTQRFDGIDKIYATGISRGGNPLFTTTVSGLLSRKARELGYDFDAFGIAASRPHENTDTRPAEVYWDTLERSQPNLSSAAVLLFEMGLSTASTIEGVYERLESYGLKPENLTLLAGAVCLDQSTPRLEEVAPGMTVVAGSKWLYIPKGQSNQFYLYRMFNPKTREYENMTPRDWGKCGCGTTDAELKSFLDLMRLTIPMTEGDGTFLYNRWRDKLND